MKKKLNVKSDCRGMFNDETIEEILRVRNIKDIDHFMNPCP